MSHNRQDKDACKRTHRTFNKRDLTQVHHLLALGLSPNKIAKIYKTTARSITDVRRRYKKQA